jgi:hypothetical protein
MMKARARPYTYRNDAAARYTAGPAAAAAGTDSTGARYVPAGPPELVLHHIEWLMLS